MPCMGASSAGSFSLSADFGVDDRRWKPCVHKRIDLGVRGRIAELRDVVSLYHI